MPATNIDFIFNVSQLLKEPIGSSRKLEFQSDLLMLSDPDVEVAETPLEAHNVEGAVRVTRVGEALLVQGDVEAQVKLECSRCLEDFLLPVEGSLEEQYQPLVDIETGRPVEQLGDEEVDNFFQLDQNHLMDLTEPVRQALLVALPMKPLHSQDCKGLCPQCGKNLNEGPCDCETETIDSRWQGLRELQLEDLPAGDSNVN